LLLTRGEHSIARGKEPVAISGGFAGLFGFVVKSLMAKGVLELFDNLEAFTKFANQLRVPPSHQFNQCEQSDEKRNRKQG
jgi:hypothetical protein